MEHQNNENLFMFMLWVGSKHHILNFLWHVSFPMNIEYKGFLIGFDEPYLFPPVVNKPTFRCAKLDRSDQTSFQTLPSYQIIVPPKAL